MISPSHDFWDPRVVMRESRSLLKAGHRVTLIAAHNQESEYVKGLELLTVPKAKSRWKRIRLMWCVFSLARKCHADVYHTHEVESFAVGLLLKWLTGAKLIWDSHECYHYTAARFLTGWQAKIVTWLTAYMLRLMCRWADHIIVVSFTNERFYREFCRQKNVTILHNSPLPELFRCDRKPRDAQRTLTHCGNLSSGRGMMKILEAVAIIKEKTPIKFIQVGAIQERDGDRELFEKRVKELKLENEVEVTGWVTYEQMAKILNRGSIGLSALQPTPNNYATLHNKTFCYMSTGQAVIGPKYSDTEKLIQLTNCGLAIDMTDPQELSESIMSLFNAPKRCRKFGRKGRKAIEQKFGWHIMERHLWGIYNDILKK